VKCATPWAEKNAEMRYRKDREETWSRGGEGGVVKGKKKLKAAERREGRSGISEDRACFLSF